MSRFLSREAAALEPYTPGEQPQNRVFNKLNTNENPYPPSPRVLEALSRPEIEALKLYSDPSCAKLCGAIAARYGLAPEQVMAGNGSDEVLSFAFRAFCGAGRGVQFADITYGFYQVWARFYGLDARIVPLRADFSLAVDDYQESPFTAVIANPNAPTGMALPPSELQRLLEADPDRIVIVDEAYVDFGGESCAPLIASHDNLLVVQTFSKSRCLAGGRVGFALGSAALIADLNRVKYSFNPYNLNRLSLLAATAAMEDEAYFRRCCEAVARARAGTVRALEALGFSVLPSAANFVFARSDRLRGAEVYQRLREKGVLVRHFDAPERIADYCRISIGSPAQMRGLTDALSSILEREAPHEDF